MPRDVLFVHSSGPQGEHEGSGDLVRNLRAGLGEAFELRAPAMPSPEDPTYAAWAARLDEVAGDAKLLVGHSLGGSVLLKWLTEKPRPALGLYLVATPFWGPRMAEFMLPDDFAARLPPISHIFLYRSRDDDVIPAEQFARYRTALPQATARELDGYGHLFAQGCPELVADLRR